MMLGKFKLRFNHLLVLSQICLNTREKIVFLISTEMFIFHLCVCNFEYTSQCWLFMLFFVNVFYTCFFYFLNLFWQSNICIYFQFFMWRLFLLDVVRFVKILGKLLLLRVFVYLCFMISF